MGFKVPEFKTYEEKIQFIADAIEDADQIAVGIGAGMSTASGFTYVGERFQKNYAEFIEEYNFFDALQAFLYPYEDPREYWAFWSKHSLLNYYDEGVGQTYEDLKKIIQGRQWFAITTNLDSAFARSGYPDNRVLHMHGRADIWECSKHCHDTRYYDNEGQIRAMAEFQENRLIPEHLVPYCPVCGEVLKVNKRTDEDGMVEDSWFKQIEKNWDEFKAEASKKKTVYLEIGVGNTRPGWIKQPFQEETEKNPNGLYLLLNHKNYRLPLSIKNQTLQMKEDIADVLRDVAVEMDRRSKK